MQQQLWTAVDDFVSETVIGSDPVLDDVLQASTAAGLPPHHVAPAQGKFLHLLARLTKAERILEFGTLAGYSTIWLARALPQSGHLVTLEANPNHAAVAQANFERARLTDKINLHLGAALETLPQIARTYPFRFDLIFIDADKENLCAYFEWSLKLSRPGTLIIADNVVREGQLANPMASDPRVRGVREFHKLLAREPRVSATTLQTVGCKGYDGFTMVVVNG